MRHRSAMRDLSLATKRPATSAVARVDIARTMHSNHSGSGTTSASTEATSSCRTCARAVFRACARPRCTGWDTARTEPPTATAIDTVASVDPSSTTMISATGYVCESNASRHARRVLAPFRHGTYTLIGASGATGIILAMKRPVHH